MSKKTILFSLFFFQLLSSCSINGNFQGLYSYYDKTKSENPNLLVETDSIINICEIEKKETPKVYIINGKDLKECIKKFDDLLIYIWSPKCKSKFCYPLNVLQQNCNNNKIELIVVSEYYDNELMQIEYGINKPIFGIDTNYYNTNTTSKYLSKFIFDLTSIENIEGRLLYFKNGVFVKVTNELKK